MLVDDRPVKMHEIPGFWNVIGRPQVHAERLAILQLITIALMLRTGHRERMIIFVMSSDYRCT